MHPEFVIRAAQAGKHVLCEKPMATNSADAERMIAACSAAKVKLMVAYRMQYEATQRATIAMVRSRELGDLRMIEAVNGQNDAPGQWRQDKALAGGGSLPDVGIYCYNAFRYLTGEEPVEITARITQPKDDPRFREIEDLAQFTLLFPSGVLGVGTSGYSVHQTRTLRAIASKGSIALDNAFAYDSIAMNVSRKAGTVNGVERRQISAEEPVRDGARSFRRGHPGRPPAAYPRRGRAAGPPDHGGDLPGGGRRQHCQAARRAGARHDPWPLHPTTARGELPPKRAAVFTTG